VSHTFLVLASTIHIRCIYGTLAGISPNLRPYTVYIYIQFWPTLYISVTCGCCSLIKLPGPALTLMNAGSETCSHSRSHPSSLFFSLSFSLSLLLSPSPCLTPCLTLIHNRCWSSRLFHVLPLNPHCLPPSVLHLASSTSRATFTASLPLVSILFTTDACHLVYFPCYPHLSTLTASLPHCLSTRTASQPALPLNPHRLSTRTASQPSLHPSLVSHLTQDKGGISFTSTIKNPTLDLDAIKAVCAEYR
jgi:hypothetical protein